MSTAGTHEDHEHTSTEEPAVGYYTAVQNSSIAVQNSSKISYCWFFC
jgi:hypothetical protein